MKDSRRSFAAFVSAALLVGGGAFASRPAQAFAPPAPAGAAQFGSVDVGQILTDSKARQKDVVDLNSLVASLRNVMLQMQTGSARFLSEAEIREYSGLLEKATPTDADKKRITALQTGGDTKAAQLTRLENVAAPTDEQKKQFGDLTDARQKGDNVLKAIADEMGKRVDSRDAELSNKTVLDIRAVISKIAQDKGLSVVFDSKIALYTANDITADVIKQINDKK